MEEFNHGGHRGHGGEEKKIGIEDEKPLFFLVSSSSSV
jgi:hypothetical protein